MPVNTAKHYIIVGVSRLAARAAAALQAGGAKITLVHPPTDPDRSSVGLRADVEYIDSPADDELDVLASCDAAHAACLIAVSDNDLTNLRWAAYARKAAPDLPVVLRVFDQSAADQLESGLNIRRAFSVSSLAAPAFIAEACKAEVLETLRIGDAEAPICRVRVEPGSLLDGMSVLDAKARFGCATIALTDDAGVWRGLRSDGAGIRFVPGQEIIIGGPLAHILTLLCMKAGWFDDKPTVSSIERSLADILPRNFKLGERTTALVLIFLALFFISVFLFESNLPIHLIDAICLAVTTMTTAGTGDISLHKAPDWVRLFDVLLMLGGAGLLGIIFSNLAAKLTAERLDDVMGRRASKTAGHIVVAGLGNLGYRISNELLKIGMRVVAVELKADGRFVDSLRSRTPVLIGDARLADTLERAGIARARGFIACANDDLVNIQASLHAKRLQPDIVAVARVFDDILAESLTDAFEIDGALSASGAAVSAFVGAALDDRAARTLRIGDEDYLAIRYRPTDAVSAEKVTEWRNKGVKILAFRAGGRALQPPSELSRTGTSFREGDEVVLCGPANEIERIVGAPLTMPPAAA